MARKTCQREAIRAVFGATHEPLSASEVLRRGRKIVGTLNQATVYRNLRTLVEQGWLRKLTHPELGPLYERTDRLHHHHFHCRVCERLYEIAGCMLDVSGFPMPGFRIEEHEVFLYGICNACAARRD